MEEGEKKKKQLVHISISTRVTIRERLRLRLVIVAVEGIPAIARESFTGNAKEKCLSSLFLPSIRSSPSPSLSRARLLFSNAKSSKSGRFLRGWTFTFYRENLLLYYGFQRTDYATALQAGGAFVHGQCANDFSRVSSSSVTFFFQLLLKCFSCNIPEHIEISWHV